MGTPQLTNSSQDRDETGYKKSDLSKLQQAIQSGSKSAPMSLDELIAKMTKRSQSLSESYYQFKGLIEATKKNNPGLTFAQQLDLSKQQSASNDSADSGKVKFVACDLWFETYNRFVINEAIEEKVVEILKFKQHSPLLKFENSEGPFVNKSVYKDIWHVHVSRDLSIFYKKYGKNPMIFELYAILDHKTSGTGDSQNIRQQQKMSDRMYNQKFDQEYKFPKKKK